MAAGDDPVDALGQLAGHLDRTLVILASEFSRDAILEGRPGEKVKDQVNQPYIIEDEKFYGMHRHFTDGSSILLWGGGVPPARVEAPVENVDLLPTLLAPLIGIAVALMGRSHPFGIFLAAILFG